MVATGAVRKIDAYREVMILEGGEQIPFRDLLSLSGECLPDNEWRWWEKRNNLGWRNQRADADELHQYVLSVGRNFDHWVLQKNGCPGFRPAVCVFKGARALFLSYLRLIFDVFKFF